MNDFVELQKYLTLVLRRWWLVLLLTLIAAGIGYGYSQIQERVYRANTSVLVGQSIQATQLDSRDILTSERLALTYADIARRQPVLDGVIVSKNLPYTWQNLRSRVRVTLVPDTQLLEIRVEASSPEEAILIADELAQQLILISPASLQNREDEAATLFVRQRIQELQTKIEAGQIKLDELAEDLVTSRDQKEQIQDEINDLEGLIVDWENTYTRFLDFVGREDLSNYIAVVDRAHAQQTPVRPSIRLNTLIAGLVGLVLALGIIFVVEFLDDTVKTLDDVSQDLNLTPLGTVSLTDDRNFRENMIVKKDPFSPESESYRMIRNNIQFMFIDNPGRIIMVTSPTAGDGKSTTAINLAIAMAHNEQKTVIVDADLRAPILHEVFGVSGGGGLTDQLRQPDSQIKVHLRGTEIDGLLLLPAGEPPPNPSELLGSQRMEKMVESLMSETEMIVFDSPPVTTVADAAILSRRVDGVVLVISAGATRRDVARQAVFNLQQAGANVLGVVLNRSTEKRRGYYRYAPATYKETLTDNRVLAGLQQARSKLTQAIQRLGMKEETEQGSTHLPDEGKEVTNNIP